MMTNAQRRIAEDRLAAPQMAATAVASLCWGSAPSPRRAHRAQQPGSPGDDQATAPARSTGHGVSRESFGAVRGLRKRGGWTAATRVADLKWYAQTLKGAEAPKWFTVDVSGGSGPLGANFLNMPDQPFSRRPSFAGLSQCRFVDDSACRVTMVDLPVTVD